MSDPFCPQDQEINERYEKALKEIEHVGKLKSTVGWFLMGIGAITPLGGLYLYKHLTLTWGAEIDCTPAITIATAATMALLFLRGGRLAIMGE